MAALQRVKILATQCGVAQSPTRSPRTSPLEQLRRRKTTLRMLLSLRSPSRREQPSIHQPSPAAGFAGGNSNRAITGRALKLKDLFVSSPSMEEKEEDDDEKEAEVEKERREGQTREEVLAAMAAKLNRACIGANLGSRQGPAWFGFSKRILLRKAWRPLLVTIPE